MIFASSCLCLSFSRKQQATVNSSPAPLHNKSPTINFRAPLFNLVDNHFPRQCFINTTKENLCLSVGTLGSAFETVCTFSSATYCTPKFIINDYGAKFTDLIFQLLCAVPSPTMERSIHEMLKDAPSLNESDGAVHSGTPPPHVPNNNRTKEGKTPTRPATMNLSLNPYVTHSLTTTPSSPVHNGDSQLRSGQSKIETIKNWSISTYKCTKQRVYETFGKTSRTIDSELETQIELLRDTQKKYCNLLRLSRALASHFHHVVQTQHSLGEAFSDLAQKSPELQEEFLYNAETQRNLTKNGETLLGALNFFVSSVNTLCNKTIEDTLITVRQYETARIEYDAYRTDLETLAQAAKSDGSSDSRFDDAQLNYEVYKQNFEKLRSDVSIKLKFLDENRIKVMHKQLLLFHNAVSAYFSGNQTALEATLKQFNIKVKSPNASLPSWLEQ